MPTDGNGVYNLDPGYFVRNGDTLLPSQHNPVLEDIAAALTARLMRDGRASMTGTLQMDGNAIAGVSSLTGGAVIAPGDFRGAVIGKLLTTDRVWVEAEPADLGNLTGTITVDFSDFLGLAHGVATGNIVLGEPANAKPGQSALLEIYQDANGGREITFDTDYWVTAEGSAIGWTDSPNARNLLFVTVLSDGKVYVNLSAPDVK